jgi:very-short-patch-repair endonuclease
MEEIKKNFARALRKHPTKTEEIVWEILRDRKFLNLKFRRQHVIKGYIVDFFCKELNLAILVNSGINIVRATNSEVMQSFHILLDRIKFMKNKLSQDLDKSPKK